MIREMKTNKDFKRYSFANFLDPFIFYVYLVGTFILKVFPQNVVWTRSLQQRYRPLSFGIEDFSDTRTNQQSQLLLNVTTTVNLTLGKKKKKKRHPTPLHFYRYLKEKSVLPW